MDVGLLARTTLLPSILVLITVLALLTRWWDKRDAADETARRGVEPVEVAQVADAGELTRSAGA